MIPYLCVIDDDPIFMTTIEIIYSRVLKLEKALIKFTNPETALEKLCEKKWLLEKKPLVILCDINMPGLQGFELIDALGKFYEQEPEIMENLQIYLLTSSISSIDKMKAESNDHIVDFISKPISPEQLIKILN